jgi:toxic protein SymE
MADAHHKPRAIISKTQRNLKNEYTSTAHENGKSDPVTPRTQLRQCTVVYRPNGGQPYPLPQITLKGHWLKEAGFATGTPLQVRVMNGCLVLTAQEPPPPEPELMQALKKVCKLSARKQRQVTELIEVISKPQRQNGN